MRILSAFVLTAALLTGTVATAGAAEAKPRTVTTSFVAGKKCVTVKHGSKVVRRSCTAKMQSRKPVAPLLPGLVLS